MVVEGVRRKLVVVRRPERRLSACSFGIKTADVKLENRSLDTRIFCLVRRRTSDENCWPGRSGGVDEC